ncbi:MAG TPA: PIG-L deacetylase family protein [Bellilinea sp.]|nr:PIG-L deacetylase family protein [Bellilinea sp.]
MNEPMTFFGRRVLFIGAHPDDIEIGAGALIAHIADKTELLCVTLSNNQKNPDLQHLVDEHYSSMAVLGVPKEKIVLGEFETRRFPHQRQEILEYLLMLRRDFQPDIVFVHSKADIHQDHGTVTDEALRAFRGTTVLGFDVIRSSYGFFPSFLVEVSEADVKKKVEALAKYTTYQSRYYFEADVTRSTLVRFGAICERPFAEGFDILRVVGTFGCLQV